MYIQEVTIEGFKSYAQRVVLPNFDPTFNAITGLNGTGKSNILDSICFVMGIKNLAQVGQLQLSPSWTRSNSLLLEHAGPLCEPSGASVQAGTGWNHQGQRLNYFS